MVKEIYPGQKMIYDPTIPVAYHSEVTPPPIGEIVTIKSSCEKYKNSFDLIGYETSLINGKKQSFDHRNLRPLYYNDACFILKNITSKFLIEIRNGKII